MSEAPEELEAPAVETAAEELTGDAKLEADMRTAFGGLPTVDELSERMGDAYTEEQKAQAVAKLEKFIKEEALNAEVDEALELDLSGISIEATEGEPTNSETEAVAEEDPEVYAARVAETVRTAGNLAASAGKQGWGGAREFADTGLTEKETSALNQEQAAKFESNIAEATRLAREQREAQKAKEAADIEARKTRIDGGEEKLGLETETDAAGNVTFKL